MYHKLEHIWNTLEHIHQQESANILEGRRSLVKLKARKFNSPINSKWSTFTNEFAWTLNRKVGPDEIVMWWTAPIVINGLNHKNLPVGA